MTEHPFHHSHDGGAAHAITVTNIIGSRVDPMLSRWLHDIQHHGHVETICLETRDMARRRLRAVTDHGTECMIALPRTECLYDGAVLLMEDRRAIVVRVSQENWLRLRPVTAADALSLGYAAGNLHWRVRFTGGDLEIALEEPADSYLARIAELIERGRVVVVTPKAQAA
jgi:urease accessory protein